MNTNSLAAENTNTPATIPATTTATTPASTTAAVTAPTTATTPVLTPATTFTAILAAGDAKAVAIFCEPLTEQQRRALINPLKDFLKSLNWRATGNGDWHTFNERLHLARHTIVPAAFAVFANATTTAKFLRTAQRANVFGFDHGDAEPAMCVLTDRAPAWLPELPAALVAHLAPEGAYRLVAAVREVAGVPLVPTREFVRAWSQEYRWNHNFDQFKAGILQDPWFAEVMPLVFDDEENDYLFTSWAVFAKAAVAAVAEGLVARPVVLDASLRRLLCGGRPGAMQNHLAFWNALEPSDEEVAARAATCISLLSAQNGSVARTFLAALKKLSDAGLLDLELALEAASIAVTRSEKNLVKTALGWLDALAARHPERAGQLTETIAIAFGAQAPDLQERAVKLVGKRGKALGQDERDRLVAEGRVYLPSDLAAMLAGLLGVQASQDEPDPAGGDAAYPEIAPHTPRPLLAPIDSPALLAEIVAALMTGDPLEAMTFERVLESFVAFGRTEAAALKEALEPVVHRWQGMDWYGRAVVATPRNALAGLATVAADAGEDKRRYPHRATLGQLWSRTRDGSWSWGRRTRTSPADFLILRAAEIQMAWGLPDLPPLVSIPTSPSGFIAPEVLAARLRECEAQGWIPLKADFHQALLRLPEDCGDNGMDASGFTSQAGVRFTAWLNGDRVVPSAVPMPDPAARHAVNWDRRAAYLRSRTSAHVKAPDSLLDLIQGVWSEPERCLDQSEWMVCWPAILPSRPDLAAVAMMGGSDWSSAPASVESAVVLAEQDVSQTATHHVIAARLVDGDARLRASGVDAALVLAARGLLDPAALSTALAAQLAVSGAGLRRLVPGLRDLANGGAPRQTWATIAVLLPGILPPAVPKTLTGTADLLALGTELVGASAERTAIAEVSALAEKKSAGTVTKAARRLAAALSSP